MKSSDKLFYVMCLVVLGLLLVGCEKNGTIEMEEGETALPGLQTPTKGLQLPPTWTIEVSSTETSTPTLTSTPTFIPRPTADLPQVPRLNDEEKIEKYIELLETNAGCKLPCWWGIVPGQTSWQEARRFLVRVANRVSNDPEFPREVDFLVPEYIFPVHLSHRYYVEDEIIQIIQVHNGMLPVYTIPDILNEYGKPDEVYIALDWEPGRDDLPLLIMLLFRDQGIMTYYGTQGVEQSTRIRACFDHELSADLRLWSPENSTSFSFVYNEFTLMYQNSYHSIEEITTLDKDAFYDLFSQGYAETCIYVIKEELYIK
jgi:hypothetical protein